MEMEVEGTRGRGRPKTRWKNCIKNDLKEKNIDEWAVYSRSEWRRPTHNGDPEKAEKLRRRRREGHLFF